MMHSPGVVLNTVFSQQDREKFTNISVLWHMHRHHISLPTMSGEAAEYRNLLCLLDRHIWTIVHI